MKSSAFDLKVGILKGHVRFVTLIIRTESTLLLSKTGQPMWGIMQEERRNIAGLDQIDNLIVELLRENARLTFLHLAPYDGRFCGAKRSRCGAERSALTEYNLRYNNY